MKPDAAAQTNDVRQGIRRLQPLGEPRPRLQIVEETGRPAGEGLPAGEGTTPEEPQEGVLRAQPVDLLEVGEASGEDTTLQEVPKALPVDPDEVEEGIPEEVPADSTELPED